MKKLVKINIIFILCFVVMITAPLVCVNRVNGKASEAENRYLVSFPQIKDKSTDKINRSFPKQFNDWINDNIGFRDLFINLNKKINFKLFNQTDSNYVVIGKDNWLFSIQGSFLGDAQNTNLINEGQIQDYKKRYSEITKYFNKLGTNFVITAFPSKVNMYSEYLPDTIDPINDKSLIDIMKDNFENNNDFDFKVPLDELKKAKESKVIYSKAYDQSHWNNYGAFIGYTEIMKQTKKYIPDLKILTENDFDINEFEKETSIGGSPLTKETDYDFKLKSPATATSDKSFFNNMSYQSKDPWKSYNYFKNSNSTLPKAIVVGDSYVWMFMLNNMAESFSELVFIHQLDINNLNQIYSIIKPDIIIGAGLDNTVLELSDYNPSLANLTSEIVSQNTPTEIERGKKYDINIIVKNTSSETWNEQKNIRLCIWQNGQDFGYRIKLPDNFDLKPNEEYTFTLKDFQAPENNTTYLEYQMVQEGVTYFGEKERVDIKVKQ